MKANAQYINGKWHCAIVHGDESVVFECSNEDAARHSATALQSMLDGYHDEAAETGATQGLRDSIYEAKCILDEAYERGIA